MANETQLPVFPIGKVTSPVRDAIDSGWGDVTSEIVIEPAYAAGLQGLAEFSHILVVFWMHQAEFRPERDLVRHPRGRTELPETGIFAQRAKHRPNPIGVTAVRLLEIRDNIVVVQGLDAIDGTPILDVKPYVSVFDRVEAPQEPQWLKQMLSNYFSV